jgi:hypothetical protein
MSEEDFYSRALEYLSGREPNPKEFLDIVKKEGKAEELEDLRNQYLLFGNVLRSADSADSKGAVNQRLKAQFLGDKFPSNVTTQEPSLSILDKISELFRTNKYAILFPSTAMALCVFCFLIFKKSDNSVINQPESPIETVAQNTNKDYKDLGISEKTLGVSDLLNFAFLTQAITISRNIESDIRILTPKGMTNFNNPTIYWTGKDWVNIEIFKEGQLVDSAQSVSESYSLPSHIMDPDSVYEVNLINMSGNIIESKTFMTDTNLITAPDSLQDKVSMALKLVESRYSGGDIYMLMSDIPTEFLSNHIIHKLQLYGLLKADAKRLYNQRLQQQN